MTSITSLNINGLRNREKFVAVISACNTDIICFQETHWDPEFVRLLMKDWKGVFFHKLWHEQSQRGGDFGGLQTGKLCHPNKIGYEWEVGEDTLQR